ncbi:hypothetical protein PANA5342_2935 [Pantoea ananatis LMG 5342]|nr:hypothetical protein PANA5342_2935 [Pantoea ananatis LMG 5342]
MVNRPLFSEKPSGCWVFFGPKDGLMPKDGIRIYHK